VMPAVPPVPLSPGMPFTVMRTSVPPPPATVPELPTPPAPRVPPAPPAPPAAGPGFDRGDHRVTAAPRLGQRLVQLVDERLDLRRVIQATATLPTPVR
jgi:hypothetical protein